MGAQCEREAIDPAARFEDSVGWVTGEDGICRLVGLPAVPHRVWITELLSNVKTTIAEVTVGVPADGSRHARLVAIE